MNRNLLFNARTIQLWITFLFFSLLLSAQKIFDKNPNLTGRFLINGGVFFPTKNVNISADGAVAVPLDEDIEFDEVFGLSDFETTLTLNFMWRFSKSKKWSLQAEFFDISNSEEAVFVNFNESVSCTLLTNVTFTQPP